MPRTTGVDHKVLAAMTPILQDEYLRLNITVGQNLRMILPFTVLVVRQVFNLSV